MRLSDLKVVCENVNLDDYLYLYKYVKDNMDHPEWLGLFTKEEIKKILINGGKIWLYYDKNIPVCSIFYIPTSNEVLRKHNIKYDEKITGSLGPVMVRKDYIGNGFQIEMMNVLNDYIKSIGKTHMFTKAHCLNKYSINNILKDGYVIIDKYETDRGHYIAFVK